MINLYDIAYAAGLGLASPVWLLRSSTRKKIFKAFSQRMGRISPRDSSSPAVMIHAVSLGEINATRSLIEALRQRRPGLQFIVSTTTDTGSARAAELYGSNSDVILCRYPLDFSSSVQRVLDGLRPSVVVLIELEVWPNFIRRCVSRGIPVLLINGRLTTASFRRYKLAKIFVSRMFSALTMVCAQDSTYQERFIALGARPQSVRVTGTMKFDTAQVVDHVAGQDELATAVGLKPGEEKIWVCGSTGPGEEQIVLDEYRRLLTKFPGLRLVMVPRKPERFDEVAGLIAAANFAIIRRSNPKVSADAPVPKVVLGDTIGDLRKFYALADVVFVGRTIVDLGARQHGSDMIEPAALAKPVIVGPFTANFAEAMEKFRSDNAMLIVKDSTELRQAVELMLDNPPQARVMALRAREVVKREQGATNRHADLIIEQMQSL